MPRPEKRNKKEKHMSYVELPSQVLLSSFAEMRSNQQISHVLLMMYILYSAVFSYLCGFFFFFGLPRTLWCETCVELFKA